VKINGLYGYLLIDMNGGYSYVINQVDPTVQALNDGDTLKDVFRYEISNGLGQPDLTTLTIQINGTNDAPRGLDDNTIAFASGGSPSAPIAGFNPSGNVLRNDSDFDNAGFTVKSFRTGSSEGSGNSGSLGSALKGTYGTFTLDNQGNWTYTVDQANVAVNALKPGESLVDSFNYTVADGTAEDIAVLNVKINGAAGFVDINNLYVNEASEYAVFTVTGQVGVSVSLALGNNGPAADPQADLTGPSADVLNSLECYDEGIAKWVPYTSPTLTAIQPSGQLLVRVKIKQDQLREGNESFSLTAITSDGNATTGFCTINDEGFGDIYLATNTTGIANKPADSGYPSFLDDDRALTVTSPTINEGSDYAILEVSGAPGQLAFLALRDASGDGGVDAPLNKADLRQNGTIPKLQYFDGANWLDYDPQNPPAVLASGKLLVRVDISAEDEKALDGPETFLLDVTNTGRKTVTGTGTIKDDGIGTTWSFTGNNVPGTPLTNNGPAAALGLDDDRALTVTSPIVNEVSKYAVFEVSGASGQLVLLALRDASGDGGVDAPLNKADLRQGGTLPKLQYFDGANWLDYDPQNPPAVLASGKLLVRVDISAEDEKALDGPETFLLDVTNTGGTTVTGTGTIKDDGTGTKWSFTGNNDPGTPDTNNGPAAALGLDDDRALTVTSTTINEVSQYAVFEVSGASGQLAFLALRDSSGDDVNGGVDASLNKADLRQGGTLPKLQYFDGANWQDYDPLKPPAILATGKLLVRVDISAEDEKALDGPENFLLDVTNAGGTTVTGTGTIKDDGTGTKWSFTGINDSGTPDTNNGPAAALGFDDDRTLTVTSPTINEVSKYAVFEVSGASGQLVLLALRDASGDDVNGGVDAPLNKADLRQGGTLPKLQYFDGVNWQDYDPLKPPAILLSGKLLVRVDISAEQDLGFDGPENFLLDVTNTGGTTVTGTGTIKDDGTGTKWAFTGSNDSGTSSQGPGPGFDDDRVPDKVNLRPQTNSGEINDRTTANGKPQIQIIGPSGHKDSYTINGPKGTLLHPSQYTIREVELPQEVGAVNKSVYIIDLIDADRTKPGSQPFGRYFQGRDTGNTANGGDGTYRILYNGANFADNDVTIRTNALSAPARAKCLTAIYGNAGDRSLESTLFGYRTDKPKGTAGDDNLSGTRKTSDSLTGLNGSDLLNGMGDRLVATLFNPADDVGTQVDRLTGGGGRDFFQLADAVGVYYVQNGDSDQAIITDFAKDDCLILKKGFGYQLQGTGTTRQLVALGAGPGGVDDRIATITGAPSALNGLNTALGGAPSSFVSFL
jgi:VCBS repeat-containing protein